MIVQIVLIVTAIKILFIPFYRSTDFEVHRNWLAITHNSSVKEWYYENTSEWTLDYPPLFAWFEYVLSLVATWFDPEMLKINKIGYASYNTIVFQRLSVIITDLIFVVGVKSCSDLIEDGKLLTFLLLVTNPGLLMVDHIHFQYNGMLFGILLISIQYMIRRKHLTSALWFCILLNFKHIFLYIAPVYFVYLLRAYCFTVVSKDGLTTPWYSFSTKNLMKLAMVVCLVFGVSFGPFIQDLPQIFSRLFPFKRGLSHAYWAPNFWALYNFADKVLSTILPKLGIRVIKPDAAMTGGLVQEYEHAVLPNVKPWVTFALTALSMLPALHHMWRLCADLKYRAVNFARCVALCAMCAFMFGWHVHEKAILLTLIPMSFLASLGDIDASLFLFLSVVGHYSLFPLLYPKNLLPIKVLMLLTHSAIAFGNLPVLYLKERSKLQHNSSIFLPLLNWAESLYLYGFMGLCLYENVFFVYLGHDKTLPFLPLMMTSVYCAFGMFYSWLAIYHSFLTFKLSAEVFGPPAQNVQKEEKKVRRTYVCQLAHGEKPGM